MPTNVHPDLVWDSVSTKDISLILSLLRSGWFPYRNPDGDFAWCRNDKRTVVMLTETALSRAQKIRRKIPRAFEITENQSTEEVLAALSDSNVKPNTWVSDSVLCIYHTLNTHGYLRCIEARRGGLLAGASLFIDLGSVVVAETMLTLEPDSAKASFCEAVLGFYALGKTCIDVQCKHPRTHPIARIGEQEIEMGSYLELLKN